MGVGFGDRKLSDLLRKNESGGSPFLFIMEGGINRLALHKEVVMERGNSLIGFTIVIAIIAVLLGVALGGADILNPHRSVAQARAIERESEIQAERERLALEIQRQEEQIRLEGQRRRQETELAILQFAGAVLSVALAVAILMMAYGVTTWLVAQGRRIAATPPSALPTNPPATSPARLTFYPRPAGVARPVDTAAPGHGGNGRQQVDFPRPSL
jgi:hypothetical protein